MLNGYNLFNVCWRNFNIFTMFIHGTEEQAKHNTLISNVNPCKDLFALYPRLRVNNHVLAPTKTATDSAIKIVSEVGHGVIEGENKPFIVIGDKVESSFLQKIMHCPSPIESILSLPNFRAAFVVGILAQCLHPVKSFFPSKV